MLFSRSAALNLLLPVGLMRSPIMTGFRADLDRLRERRDDRSVLGNRRGERPFAAHLDHFTDVRRCRAAAAAERVHAHAGNLSHESRKLLCVDIEYRRAVFAARQTGIRIDNDRKRGNLGQALDDRLHLVRGQGRS